MKVGEGRTKCFWIEPTGWAAVGLRRFTFGPSSERGVRCPEAEHDWGHDATRIVERLRFEVVWKRDDEDGYVSMEGVPDELVPAHTSRLWPRCCDRCGEKFPPKPAGMWQAFVAQEFTRSDTGETFLERASGLQQPSMAGALYDATWLHGRAGESFYKVRDRGDGIILLAVTPNGVPWVVDGEASSGGYWERTGDPRNPETLTVSPSILVPGYHGFLQQGWFTAHIG